MSALRTNGSSSLIIRGDASSWLNGDEELSRVGCGLLPSESGVCHSALDDLDASDWILSETGCALV
jgi:hypothetical protein